MIANRPPLLIGTAGWSIAARHAADFPGPGSHLERYGRRMPCVEIDTSFYRPHRRETYERWARSVPGDFRFSVKLPKTITHASGLVGCDGLLADFLAGVQGLGAKLAVLLVQLPPSLVFDSAVAEPFFRLLLRLARIRIVCEPRHASWALAGAMLEELDVSRVAAHPAAFEGAERPAGAADLAYFRMHGAPRIYFSAYPPDELQDLQRRLSGRIDAGAQVWCIFDNTAAGHALGNALALDAMEGASVR